MKILKRIVECKKERVSRQKQEMPLAVLKNQVKEIKFQPRDFKKAISEKDGIALIAEIKKSSPSAGILRQDFDPIAIAKEYEKAGAACISILTEENFFQGSMDILSKVRSVSLKPILAKDFFIDEYQIYSAKLHGADCILLIVSILENDYLNRFLQISKGLGMDCLVEVHNEIELKKAINSEADLIGINNRNLENFKVDLRTTENLYRIIPEGRLTISESGINTRADVEYLSSIGVDAILVGETLMRAKNIPAKIRELLAKNG